LTVPSEQGSNLIERRIFMEKTPKELMKAYVDSQKFSSTTEIISANERDVSRCASAGDGERTGGGAGI